MNRSVCIHYQIQSSIPSMYKVPVTANGQSLSMEIDIGASASLISNAFWKSGRLQKVKSHFHHTLAKPFRERTVECSCASQNSAGAVANTGNARVRNKSAGL